MKNGGVLSWPRRRSKTFKFPARKCSSACDFNVPLDANKNITDENRIRGALPTIQYLIDHGAKVILCSHLGRPKGEFNMKYSSPPSPRA